MLYAGKCLNKENRSISRILCSESFFDLGLEIQDLRFWKRSGDHSSSPTVARLDPAIYPEVVVVLQPLRAGSPCDASLFDLAPRGVCLAVCVTTYAVALLL